MKPRKILSMPNGKNKAVQLAIHGLLTDGGHHKQWYLERILEALNVNLTQLRIDLVKDGYDWDEGIAS